MKFFVSEGFYTAEKTSWGPDSRRRPEPIGPREFSWFSMGKYGNIWEMGFNGGLMVV